MDVCTNEYGGTNNSRPSSTEGPVKHYRKSFVGDDIAQEKRDQDPMLASLKQLQDLGRVLALVLLAG